jgi:transcriptional regulator GlxA family with amidase domain
MHQMGTPSMSRVSAARRIERIRLELAANIEQIPAFAELASLAGMSRSQLSRNFHRFVGASLRAYVLDLRLKRACELLTDSTQSITATSVECGFYDASHFDRVFRRRFGITPGQFRRRYVKPRKAG